MPDESFVDSTGSLLKPDVSFYIYPTPASAESPPTEDIGSLLPSTPLTLVMHGFKGDSTAKSMLAIKQALLLSGVQNVVIVDWGPLSDSPKLSALTAYGHVRDHGVPSAGSLVAGWLLQVMRLKDISPDQVHLVGFSLGAHLAGVVGRLLNSTVGRITALDPPMFGYQAVPLAQRLDLTAAKFVNVIHTTNGVISYSEPIGHVDFFPNGDTLPQPGCPTENAIHIVTCSHFMSYMLFSESVLNKNALVATKCSSWLSFVGGLCKQKTKTPMGYATPNTTRGMFFMKTNENLPFGAEDPAHPIPEEMKLLLVYNEKDSIIDFFDVVSFFAHKESSEESADVDNSLSAGSHELEANRGSKVMRVHSGKSSSSATSTTEAPPAFLNKGSCPHVFSFVLLVLTVFNLRNILFSERIL